MLRPEWLLVKSSFYGFLLFWRLTYKTKINIYSFTVSDQIDWYIDASSVRIQDFVIFVSNQIQIHISYTFNGNIRRHNFKKNMLYVRTITKFQKTQFLTCLNNIGKSGVRCTECDSNNDVTDVDDDDDGNDTKAYSSIIHQ